MSRQHRSPLWRFFTPSTDTIAVCNICKHKLSYKTTTTNLRRHMTSKHPTVSLDFLTMDRLLNVEKEIDNEEPTPPKKAKVTIKSTDQLNRFMHSNKRPLEIDASQNSSQDHDGTEPKRCKVLTEPELNLEGNLDCDGIPRTTGDKTENSNTAVPSTSSKFTAVPSTSSKFITSTALNRQQSTSTSFTTILSDKQIYSKQQQTMSQYIPKKMSLSQKTKIDSALMSMFIKDFQPFSILEDEGFTSYSKAMNPSYVLPNRKTISNTILTASYEECLTNVQEKVRDAKSICLTTDSWTSRNTEDFVAVTAHFFDNNLELQSVLLQCAQFAKHHTSENLAQSLLQITNEWNITDKSDNAKNITKAIKDILKWKHMGCFAHSLNLIVKDALKIDNEVVNILEKIRKIVAHFKRSTTSTAKLMSYQKNNPRDGKLKVRKLVLDVATRWNSTYFMLRRLVLLQEPLKATIALIGKDLPVLTPSEWKIVCELVIALKPFHSITRSMSGEKYATSSLAIPLALSLRSVCQKLKTKVVSAEAKNVVQQLILGVLERFENLENSRTLTLTTFLDPRFKNIVFSSSKIGEDVKQRVIDMVSSHIKQSEIIQTAKSQDTSKPSSSHDDLSIWSDLDGILAKKQKKGTHGSRAIVEVDRYLEEDLLNKEEDPIRWWKDNQHLYPNIFNLFQKYFCVLATSVPCERVFSKAGIFLSERRNRLSSNKTKMLMFLNQNLASSRSSTTERNYIRNTKFEDAEEEELQKIILSLTKEISS